MKSTMEQQAALIESLDEELNSMDRELLICKGIIAALAIALALVYVWLR